MRKLKDIDIAKSISTRKLHYSKEWNEKLDTVIFLLVVVFGFFICPLLIISSEVDLKDPNERFIGLFILPPVIIFGLYLTYRKLTELRLTRIATALNKEEAVQSLIQFAEQENFNIRRKSNFCVVMDQNDSFPNTTRTAVILVLDNELFYTMVENNFKLNSPTIISHIFFKQNLKKWLQDHSKREVEEG